MRLLLICHEFPPIGGGGGRAAHALARLLGETHDVTVITARGSESPMRDGRYRVIEVGPRRRLVFGATPVEMMAFAVAAVRAASRLELDGCIAVQSLPAGYVAWWLAKRRGVPYVLRLVGADVPGFLPESYGRFEWVLRWTSGLTWPRARAVVANSHGLRDLAERTARRLGMSVDVIANGVDGDFFRPGDGPRPSGPLKLVFVGRLVRQKGLHELVEALTFERARLDGRVEVEIIGDGGEAPFLAQALRQHGLQRLVTLTHWLPRDAIVGRLQAADAFVLPSLDEGMPSALLEAMACGLPAIGTSVSGTVELIENGVNGWLVPPRDAAALGTALVEAAATSRDRLADMGRASRERATLYSWRATAEAYERRLTAAAESRRKVLVVCHEYPPIGGGAATVAASLAHAIGGRRDVTVLTSRYAGLPREEMQASVRVRRVPTLRRATYGASPLEMVVFTISALATAVRLCRRERFEGCLAIQGIPGAWVAMPLRWWFGVPYLVALVGADVPGFLPERFDRLHRRVAWLTRLTWRRAAGVAANSESLRALAQRTAASLGVAVDMVLYGADTTVYQPPATPRRDDLVRFLFVGRLSTQKGIRFLLEATARAVEDLRGRAAIIVVGDGEDGDAMKARARAEGLEELIEFRGWLSRDDLAKCYAEASVFVLPSLDEGRSQAALEAMASGLAVIATDIMGNAGLVEEGVNGLLVPPRDAAALANALTTMVHLGPAKLAAMGDASRARVGRFSWDDAALHYLRSLETAVAPEPR